MILPAFRLHRPATVAEAIEIAGASEGDFDYIAGGTDLLPNYKNRLNPKKNVIALSGIKELSSSGKTEFGAMFRLADFDGEQRIREQYTGLAEAVEVVATPLIRQQASLGGNLLVETRCYYFNQSHDWRASKGYCMKADGDVCLVVPQKEICYAIYAGDTAAPLMTLDAAVRIRGFGGQRDVRLRDFFQPDGIRKNVMERGDLITRILLPPGAAAFTSGYLKLRLRDSFDFPDAGVAAAVRLDGNLVEDLQIAVTAVSMTPQLFPEVTAPVCGERLTPDLIEHLSDAVASKTQPVRNVMFPPQYRKRMVGLFTRRLLKRLAEPASRAA